MVVVPARHLALVLVAARVRGDAEDGFMGSAVTEAALAVRGAVLGLVSRLQLEAFVTECWVSNGRLFIWVVEGDIVFVRRALCSSDGWHAAATGRGSCGRLRVDIVKNASGEPRVDEMSTGLEQGVVVHPDVLFQGLEARIEHGASCGLGAEPYDFRSDPRVIDGVDVLVHEFFQASVGVEDVEVVVPYQLVVAQVRTTIRAARVQRLMVDRGLFAIAPL